MQLHITREGQQFGPYDLAQVNEMLAQGSLLPTDYAWYEGAADWTPLDQVPGITIPGAKPAPVEAIPVTAVANQSTPADAQPTAGAATATAGAAKGKNKTSRMKFTSGSLHRGQRLGQAPRETSSTSSSIENKKMGQGGTCPSRGQRLGRKLGGKFRARARMPPPA